MEWINFNIAKPTKSGYYLTFNNQFINTISIWNHKYFKSLSGTIVEDITHWMPLPPSPKQ